jgi:transmembrane sensor
MEKDNTYYSRLIDRWLKNECSVQEVKELMAFLDGNESSKALMTAMKQQFDHSMTIDRNEISLDGTRVEAALSEKIAAVVPVYRRRRRIGLALSAAAAILLCIIAGIYFLVPSKKTVSVPIAVTTTEAKPAIRPGKSRAVLTLANGKQIVLDSASVGRLAEEGNAAIVNKGGRIEYATNGIKTKNIVYNTLSTGRGESYPLMLSDGTRLWLNAASSVRFPTTFTGNQRNVSVTGEVYFEVAKNRQAPFRVSVNDMIVEVTGTTFNINAYADEEKVRTTLVEGSVNVRTGQSALHLSPGEQSQLTPGGLLSLQKNVNIEQITAWKEGYFHFENAELGDILRQFARWYDVDVVFEGKIKPRKFFGIVSRNSSLEDVLKLLKANDIQFRTDGKKLIVQS